MNGEVHTNAIKGFWPLVKWAWNGSHHTNQINSPRYTYLKRIGNPIIKGLTTYSRSLSGIDFGRAADACRLRSVTCFKRMEFISSTFLPSTSCSRCICDRKSSILLFKLVLKPSIRLFVRLLVTNITAMIIAGGMRVNRWVSIVIVASLEITGNCCLPKLIT